VTFSDPKVAEAANASFVCAWFNRSPGFTNCDDAAEKSIFQNSSEAFLTKNICTFVMSPDGRVFHYVAGYVSPELFLGFLEDALALRRAGFDGKMKPLPGGLDALRRLHAERAVLREKEAASTSTVMEIAARTYRGVLHAHADRCKWTLKEASRYLGRVHRSWEKAAALPTLDEVRFKYLYGNPFSEEGQGASPIANDLEVMVRR